MILQMRWSHCLQCCKRTYLKCKHRCNRLISHSVIEISIKYLCQQIFPSESCLKKCTENLNMYLWKRSWQHLWIFPSVSLKADTLNSSTQSSGGTNRSPEKQNGVYSVKMYCKIQYCASDLNQKLLPAIQALTRDTQVPVIIALSTRDEISPLLDGHIEAFKKRKDTLTVLKKITDMLGTKQKQNGKILT